MGVVIQKAAYKTEIGIFVFVESKIILRVSLKNENKSKNV